MAKALLDTYIVSVRGNKEKTGKKKEKLSRPGGGEQRRRVERKLGWRKKGKSLINKEGMEKTGGKQGGRRRGK